VIEFTDDVAVQAAMATPAMCTDCIITR